jgi:alpha-maltose-1-phosphate synthase
MADPNFGIYYVGDGYSTSKKIMGRQSAGKALIRGLARKWPEAIISGFGTGASSSNAMVAQLKSEGFAGKVRWYEAEAKAPPQGLNALYYPAPPVQPVAERRNKIGATSYSIFGVTHTLSSAGAMDQIADLIMPPFQPWDALICTSTAALRVVDHLHEQARDWWHQTTGATRFNPITKVVIPLGVNAPDFAANAERRAAMRAKHNLSEDDICFLFSGRMTFHAKANPVALYQALDAASVRLNKRLVCIEAGVYPNDGTCKAFDEAKALLAPSARFIAVDGNHQDDYDEAWAGADVFVSLSDNVQETFGITPLEAMAAGLPVIVSDWNGYKDTVRDGVDGFRIPVIMPSAGSGIDLAARHDQEVDTYDYYIGRLSMTTVIDVGILTQRMVDLAGSETLRKKLGGSGQRRVNMDYDWPVILSLYKELADELARKRQSGAADASSRPIRNRPDPYALFADYPTSTLSQSTEIALNQNSQHNIETFLDLGIASYVINPVALPREAIIATLDAANNSPTLGRLIAAMPDLHTTIIIRALMWLAKMGLVFLGPRPS